MKLPESWKLIAFTVNLLLGLVLSQIIGATVEKDALKAFVQVIQALVMWALSFIMINVGYEFTIDKDALCDYLWDYLIAMTAAGFPWLFVAMWFIITISGLAADKAFLIARFAAPTSAGILFSMLDAAGLRETWVFNKARILAIFDDLDTIILMIPLKVVMIGFKWELTVVIGIMVILLVLAWCKLHVWRLPYTWKWTLFYAFVVATICKVVDKVTKMYIEPIHIEVLLPAFVLGCIIDTPCAREELKLQKKMTFERRMTRESLATGTASTVGFMRCFPHSKPTTPPSTTTTVGTIENHSEADSSYQAGSGSLRDTGSAGTPIDVQAHSLVDPAGGYKVKDTHMSERSGQSTTPSLTAVSAPPGCVVDQSGQDWESQEKDNSNVIKSAGIAKQVDAEANTPQFYGRNSAPATATKPEVATHQVPETVTTDNASDGSASKTVERRSGSKGSEASKISKPEERRRPSKSSTGSKTSRTSKLSTEDLFEHKVHTTVSMVFMVLVGLSTPPLVGKNADDSSDMEAGLIVVHVIVVSFLMVLGKMFPAVCYRDEAPFSHRVALCLGMCPRGEVGASIIVISLELGVEGPAIIISIFCLVINLVMSGGFIGAVKVLLKGLRGSPSKAATANNALDTSNDSEDDVPSDNWWQ